MLRVRITRLWTSPSLPAVLTRLLRVLSVAAAVPSAGTAGSGGDGQPVCGPRLWAASSWVHVNIRPASGCSEQPCPVTHFTQSAKLLDRAGRWDAAAGAAGASKARPWEILKQAPWGEGVTPQRRRCGGWKQVKEGLTPALLAWPADGQGEGGIWSLGKCQVGAGPTHTGTGQVGWTGGSS